MIDRRLLQHFDWALLALVMVIGGLGILTLYSAVSANAEVAELRRLVYIKQSYWLAIGTGVDDSICFVQLQVVAPVGITYLRLVDRAIGYCTICGERGLGFPAMACPGPYFVSTLRTGENFSRNYTGAIFFSSCH